MKNLIDYILPISFFICIVSIFLYFVNVNFREVIILIGIFQLSVCASYILLFQRLD